MPLSLGYTLSSEEQPPGRLVDLAERAEGEGFDFVSISDHLHPWVDAQGHAPFVWSVLGAIAARTRQITVAVGVTCPIERFPPYLAAHASATTACLMPNRFVFGVGSGEALNEHITGASWPAVDVRHDMLEEAVEIIRMLWSGSQVTYRGRHYQVEAARLYDTSEEPPPLIVSAFGPRAARLTAHIGDGLWTHATGEMVDPWRDEGGEGPVFAQISICVADSIDEATTIAHRQWPNAGLRGQLSQDLPTPRHVEWATSSLTREQIRSSVLCGPDPEPVLDAIVKARDRGVDHVYLHQIGADQDAFFRMWQTHLAPALASERQPSDHRVSSVPGV